MTEQPAKTFKERCHEECTRNVLFVLQRRFSATSKHWETIKVFLTREEGEAYAKARTYDFHQGWRVYGVPAEGPLAQLIANT